VRTDVHPAAVRLCSVLPVRTVPAKPPVYLARELKLRDRVLRMRASGIPFASIGRQLGCGKSTAWRITKGKK